MTIRDALDRLLALRPLGEAEAEALFEIVLSGGADEAQIAALLALIQARGATVDELVGASRVMRRRVTPVPLPEAGAGPPPTVIDTCGTGGAAKAFNVSTAAAIVTAAASPHHEGGPARVWVAKHGNRSRTGRGSAEVLAALGVDTDAPPERQTRCLAEAGVCFCFAIHHHPAAKHAAGVRRSLGFPTLFNLVGPLTNPAGASRQLIGIYDARLAPLLALALARLGAERAMVVHSHDGLDELSIAAPSTIAHVERGVVTTGVVSPADAGLPASPLDSVRAGTVDESARLIRGVLRGDKGPHRDIVIFNSAAALVVAGAAADLRAGAGLACRAIDTGRAAATMDRLASASRG